ncbi:hypothetical protein [Ferrimicrobium sp.]|uniref:hypothetical protein n=1 Tax=Ferrimicrobium sp. TaxID=2926050 RepID=UPI00260FCAD2|nr:hypothetical protein [Ferrimicrobium sp.]
MHTLPNAALGGGLLAVFVSASVISLGRRWSRPLAVLILAVTIVYSWVAWYALRHQGLVRQGFVPWLLLGGALGVWLMGLNRWTMLVRWIDLGLGLGAILWMIGLVSGGSLVIQRGAAQLLIGRSSVELSVIALFIGLVVLVGSRWAPESPRGLPSDDRLVDQSWSLSSLLRYPGLTLGAISVIRVGPRTWLRLLLGALALVPLGIGLAEGLLVLGPLVAALGCWLGWELSPIASTLVRPEGLLGVLPRTRGSYGRRGSVLPALLASVLLVAAIGVAWRVSYLVGFGTVLVLALGCGVGFFGAGVALRVMAVDPSLAQGRWVTGVLAVALAGCALAPLVQLNNAFGAHGLFFEYVITGSSFSVIMGIVGISLVSWWRGEVRDT